MLSVTKDCVRGLGAPFHEHVELDEASCDFGVPRCAPEGVDRRGARSIQISCHQQTIGFECETCRFACPQRALVADEPSPLAECELDSTHVDDEARRT